MALIRLYPDDKTQTKTDKKIRLFPVVRPTFGEWGTPGKMMSGIIPPALLTPVKPKGTYLQQQTELRTGKSEWIKPTISKEQIEPKIEGTFLEQYKGTEIKDPQKEPWWRRAVKALLPKKAEKFFGLDEMPEKTIQQKMIEQEEDRQSYLIERGELKNITLSRQVRNFITGMGGTVEGMIGAAQWLTPVTMQDTKKFFKEKGDQVELWQQLMIPEDRKFLDDLVTGAGSVVTFFIPGLGTAKAASVIAKVSPKMAMLFGNVVATFLESATEAGSVYREKKGMGADEVEASWSATKTFVANSILIGLTNKFGVFSDRASSGLKRMLMSAPMEGIQEYWQEVIQNVNTGKPTFENAFRSGIIGTLLGFPMGGVSSAVFDTLPKTEQNRILEKAGLEEMGEVTPTGPVLTEIKPEPLVKPTPTIPPEPQKGVPAELKQPTKAIPKELQSLAKIVKRFESVGEFEKGFIETITKSRVFKEVLGYQSYKLGKPDVRIVPAVKKFPDALKALTEGRNITLSPEWTSKVLTEISGLNLEKTLLRIEKGLDIVKNESPTLRDFYTQATKEVKPTAKPVEVKPIGKPSKVAVSIEAKAIEKGITEQFKGLAEYEPVVIKEQTAKINKLMKENIEKAKNMATGKEPLSKDIKGAMLVKMIEDYAMEQKDGKLIMELANSPLVSETSEAGQTLRLIAERVPDSATAKIREIKKEREAVAEKKRRGKTKKQAKDEIKKSLDKKIADNQKKLSKYAWESLINEITC